MKQLIFILFIFSQLATGQMEFLTRMPNHLGNNPPGTLKLNDSLSIDKSPVTNSMYLEMLESVRNGWNYDLVLQRDSMSINEITRIPMDTVKSEVFLNIVYPKKWLSQNSDFPNFSQHQYTYPEYSESPITEVTQEQARFFCRWRTNMLYLAQKNDPLYKDLSFNKFTYRLITRPELEKAVYVLKEKDDLVELDQDPLSYTRSKLKRFSNKEKLLIFNNNIVRELTIENKSGEEGMFRCICEVK